MALLDEQTREYLVVSHRMEVLLNAANSGRIRRFHSIPAEEIAERRELWVNLVAGKTARELHASSEFGSAPEEQIQVWLWAIVHPVLGITCNPDDGIWDQYPNPNPYPLPEHLLDDITWWRRELGDTESGCNSRAELDEALKAELKNTERLLRQ